MKNKIFIKIGIAFAVVIILYLFFMISLISPKITNYFLDFETNQVKQQLNKVYHVTKSKENQIKDFETLKYRDYRREIKDISNVVYNVAQTHYEMYKKGLLSKQNAISNILTIASKIEYGHQDYIYVINSKADVLYHPEKKYKNKNIYNEKDENNRVFIPTIIKNVIEQKETYSTYFWRNKKTGIISEKLAYSIYFEPLDMIFTSFIHKSNINLEVKAQKEKLIVKLIELIDTFLTNEDGYVFILDKNFKVVMHPNKELINEDFNDKKYENIINVKKLEEDIVSASKNKVVWKYSWNTKEDTENYDHKKFGWVAYNDYFDWYIISSIYEEELNEKAKEIDSIVVNLSIALLFILMTIAIFFVKKLLKPIEDLTYNANLVKNGNLDIRAKISSKDELGILANHFNRMLDVIQENTKNLEAKVEKRTLEIKRKLYYDELTGLKNRESLIEDLNAEADMVALTLVDISNFDDINELYGYKIGNEVLIKVVQSLKKYGVKSGLELYRVDGDVFAFKDTNMMNFIRYEHILSEIHGIFGKEFIVKSLDIELFLSINIGASISQSEPLKTANIALKRGKRVGYKTMVYNKDIDTKDNIKKMMHWKDKIKFAIDNDKVVPFFQPIFNKDKKLIKYEALMRIKDNIDGKDHFLAPGNFFDVALKTKQYFKLNQIVIKKAFDNIDIIGKLVSVNISFLDILNLDFMDFIEEEIEKLSLEQRKKVIFEILESEFISDHKVLEDFIIRYRKKGIRFAIDDFGTGYSNFTHVLNIKPEYIKIDGSLIKDIDTDQTSYEMVKSIIDFCRSLNIIVVVEFIHNETVYKILQDLGADEYQGFYLGKPQPLF